MAMDSIGRPDTSVVVSDNDRLYHMGKETMYMDLRLYMNTDITVLNPSASYDGAKLDNMSHGNVHM